MNDKQELTGKESYIYKSIEHAIHIVEKSAWQKVLFN